MIHKLPEPSPHDVRSHRSNVFEDWMRGMSSSGRQSLMAHLRRRVAWRVHSMSRREELADPMRILARSIVGAYARDTGITVMELEMLLDDPVAHAQVAILNLALDQISDEYLGINGRELNPGRRGRRFMRRHGKAPVKPESDGDLPPLFL